MLGQRNELKATSEQLHVFYIKKSMYEYDTNFTLNKRVKQDDFVFISLI